MESFPTVLDGIRYDQLVSLLITAVGLLYYFFSRWSRPCLRFVNNPMQPFFIMTARPCSFFVRCAGMRTSLSGVACQCCILVPSTA
jgi:hypothetical protein